MSSAHCGSIALCGLSRLLSQAVCISVRVDYAVSIDARCIRIVTVASGEAKAWSASALR